MSAEQLSNNEMDALLQEDSLLPDYGDVPQKEVISILLRVLPQYLREGLTHLSETRIGISHLQVVVKEKNELFKDQDEEKFYLFKQSIKDLKFKGDVLIASNEASSFKIAKSFLGFPEDHLTARGIKELQNGFSSLTDGIFSLIENDYGKSIALASMVSEESTLPKQAISEDGFFIEIAFNMTVASVSCPIYFIMPFHFGSSIAKLIEQEPYEDLNIKTARPIQFSPLNTPKNFTGDGNKIDILLDVSMQLTAELGRTRVKIRDILGLGEGSIIELQKLAGEAVDVLVNGKVIAKGEVVVIDEYFGVRVTEIEAPKEIIQSLEVNS